ADINGDLDVDGHTNLDNVSVGGATTMSGDLRIQSASPSIYFTDTNNNPDYLLYNSNGSFEVRDVSNNGTRLQVASSGNVNIFKDLNVTGDIDVDGHTNLDNVSVSGVSTFAGNADFSAGIDVTGTITGTSHVDLPDAAEIKLGNSDEFLIYHTATGTSYIKETGSGDLYIDATNIRLRSQNGNEKLATTSTGVS
ncbi:MAG: hypothetical protein VXY93_19560, partial [Pseudomonadota bacterium]|nr:hypothetical protein [Pseudomonadota bacterium]